MHIFKIFIKNLKLYGYHGVNPEEKKEGQYFVFNIEINIFKNSFKGCDYLSETVNYSEAVNVIKEVNAAARYDLLETLAEEITIRISGLSLLISKVKTRVEKISPPINEKLESVGAEFELDVNNEVEKESDRDCIMIYLSIGTNMGNRLENIKKALHEVYESGIFSFFEVSSIYETEPMYVKNQDNFYNLVVKAAVKKSMNPFAILGYLKSIEYEMGRGNQVIKNGPRIIDIDILSIEDIKINSDILKLPHPGLPERNFVLVPLSEIEPDFKINGVKINEFISQSKFPQKVSKINTDMIIF
jgi:dihydroneopterin aldolase / 2-amino-4-hydroxy-6-hydroxymethyldihydropteridine diphosphokinase